MGAAASVDVNGVEDGVVPSALLLSMIEEVANTIKTGLTIEDVVRDFNLPDNALTVSSFKVINEHNKLSILKQLLEKYNELTSSNSEEIPEKLVALYSQIEAKQKRNSKALSIIICGAPASGKGTQCEYIKNEFGLIHLSTGDMLRAAVKIGSPLGMQAKEQMESGQLVSDDLITGVVVERLAEKDCQACGCLLDGFPRTGVQADAFADIKVHAFILLDVPQDILVERVVGRRSDPETGKIYHMKFSPPEDEAVLARLVQRADDTEEKAVIRFQEFANNVAAVEDKFKDVMVTIDGTRKPEDVWTDVCKALQDAYDRN